MSISDFSTDEIRRELVKRGERKSIDRCPTCRGKWTVYMGCSRSWREELHCYGCRKPVAYCSC